MRRKICDKNKLNFTFIIIRTECSTDDLNLDTIRVIFVNNTNLKCIFILTKNLTHCVEEG